MTGVTHGGVDAGRPGPSELAGLRLLVVGAGLIGASVALAARAAGAEVEVSDSEESRARLASSLGAGRVRSSTDDTPVDLAVVATPPRVAGAVLVDLLRRGVATTVTHVCSVQTLPQVEVEAAGASLDRFLGSHPIAGREVSGPGYASADLFRDRPWVLCPTPSTAPSAVEAVRGLVRSCGAVPVLRDAARHDRLLARLSHAPQLVASALAAALLDVTADDAALAGTGMRDTTRLADSDPHLWEQIVTANAGEIAAAVRAVAGPLLDLAAALEAGRGEEPAGVLLAAGRRGRALLPGKHGRPATDLAVVHVVVPDEPGSLADLLTLVARERVNLEDLRVDHAPGQPLGVVELVIAPADRDRLLDLVRDAGWSASPGRSEAL